MSDFIFLHSFLRVSRHFVFLIHLVFFWRRNILYKRRDGMVIFRGIIANNFPISVIDITVIITYINDSIMNGIGNTYI